MYSDRRGPTAFSSFLSSRLGPNAPADNGPPAGGNWSRGGGGGRGRGRGRGRRGGAQGGGPPEQGEIVFGGDKDGDIGMGGEDDAGKKRLWVFWIRRGARSSERR